MDTFVAIDFETANRERSSVCSIGLVFVEGGQITDTYYRLIRPLPNYYSRFNTEVHGLPPHQNAFFCTCRQARRVFPRLPNHRLDTVARHVGYRLDHHHHALADAEACAYIALQVF